MSKMKAPPPPVNAPGFYCEDFEYAKGCCEKQCPACLEVEADYDALVAEILK